MPTLEYEDPKHRAIREQVDRMIEDNDVAGLRVFLADPAHSQFHPHVLNDAAGRNREDIVVMMADEFHWDVNQYGGAALLRAATANHRGTVFALLTRGADPTLNPRLLNLAQDGRLGMDCGAMILNAVKAYRDVEIATNIDRIPDGYDVFIDAARRKFGKPAMPAARLPSDPGLTPTAQHDAKPRSLLRPPRISSVTPLYHATPPDRRQSIMERGLRLEFSSAWLDAPESEKSEAGAIYLCTKRPELTSDVWEVDIKGLTLVPDDFPGPEDPEDSWWQTFEDIPPSRLKLLNDLTLTPVEQVSNAETPNQRQRIRPRG